MRLRLTYRARCIAILTAMGVSLLLSDSISAQVVPGTGTKLTQVGDDFEATDWSFVHNLPKGSKENDERTRGPNGFSTNNRWFEGPMRGQPDHIERVETPEGGIEGSTGALLIQSLRSGVPQLVSFKPQQDDLVANVKARVGGYLTVAKSPNVTTRVFIPPPEQWEKRSGVSFGFRAGTYGRYYGPTRTDKEGKKIKSGSLQEYWPGLFIQLNPERGDKPATAQILVRSNNRGFDMNGPVIHESGWWTLGMSFTPDGKIHYYASPGVDPLTSQDYITSSYPYGYICERFTTFFYNVVNLDDGRSWSTPWVVDDPEVFVLR